MSPSLIHHQLHAPDRDDTGEVVLLLNGGMMTHPSWQPMTEALLADGYRVLGCDFRGQLQSPVEGHGPERLEEHVPDVIDLLDALGLDRVHVLGTSFGGMIGQLLAARHPERVLSLAAVTTVARTPPGMAERSRQTQELARNVVERGETEPFHAVLLEDIYSEAYRRDHAEALEERRRRTGDLPESWYRGLHGILACIQDFDLTPELGKIRCPTLVVHAAQDRVMPTDHVKALAAAVDGAELEVHPESGHALVVEDPDWLRDRYRSFLARLRRPARA